ncbi:lysophospholipase [Shewanella sp. A3A]|nr:lysophospholipase [Shewanella ferrihydritica]
MKTLIATALFIASSSALASPSETEVTLATTTGALTGSLIKADNDQGTVALIIAGSGPTDRNGNNAQMQNNSLQLLAEGLATQGISSLRYDKRGVAASLDAGPSETDLRFSTYVDDAVLWLDYLRQQQHFKKLVIIGHSEGSLVGILAAQQTPVSKLVSIAGVGDSAAKIIRVQLEAQPEVVKQQASPILAKLEQGETVAEVPTMLNALFRPSVQPYLISWFQYDPAKEIAKLQLPLLVLQGSHDIQVDVQQATLLADANPRAQKVIIDGMNHILKLAPQDRQANIQTYNNPELPLADKVVSTISEFIKK